MTAPSARPWAVPVAITLALAVVAAVVVALVTRDGEYVANPDGGDARRADPAGAAAVLQDLRDAVDSFIDPLDGNLLALQELAAVLACSDRRFLPEKYKNAPRAELSTTFTQLKHVLAGR